MKAPVAVLLAVLAGFLPGFLAIADAPAAENGAVSHDATVRIEPADRSVSISDRITVQGREAVPVRVAPWLKIVSLSIDGKKSSPTGPTVRLADRGSHSIALELQGKAPAPGRSRGQWQDAAIGADGGYFFAGSAWLPRIEGARVSYRVRVDVPADQRVVVTGRLVSETIGKKRYGAVFESRNALEPPSLFVGPYVVKERKSGDLRLRTYFYRDQAGLADGYLDDSAHYIERYSRLIGAYPYSDFHVIAAPIPVGLGFPNLTYIGRRILPLPFLRGRSLAHEVLHNWWGNGVGIDYASGNWAEGLTTYMADYALAAERDSDGGAKMRLGWLRDFAALPPDRDTPVVRFTGKHSAAAQVVGYNKVSFIFHMLRAEIGEDSFTAGLREFWRRYRNDVASWKGLRGAFEAASGRDLSGFFIQWLNRAGAPQLTLHDAGIEGAQGAYRVRFTLRQGSPPWRLRIPVSVRTEGGAIDRTVDLSGAEQSFTLDVDRPPLALRIDPDWNVFRRLLPGEAPPILRDVTLAADTATVIAAHPEMEKTAQGLARRLLDTRMRIVSSDAANPANSPVLVIGETSKVAEILVRLDLGDTPEPLVGRGTARVWTVSKPGRHPALIVAADGQAALAALLRPLPHYGGRSYLVFDGRRAIDKGVWPATHSPLTRSF